jgi:L-amino acid N-acyltransferase YncA
MKIREAIEDDLESIKDIFSYYVLYTVVSYDYTPPTIEFWKEKFKYIKKNNDPFLVIVDDNDKILGFGYLALWNIKEGYKFTREITIYLDNNITKKGLGKLLLDELLNISKNKGIINIMAGISGNNEISINFFKKNGFKKVIKFF